MGNNPSENQASGGCGICSRCGANLASSAAIDRMDNLMTRQAARAEFLVEPLAAASSEILSAGMATSSLLLQSSREYTELGNVSMATLARSVNEILSDTTQQLLLSALKNQSDNNNKGNITETFVY